jgi:hypothetical protein
MATWTCYDGRKLALSELTANHLINSYIFLLNKKRKQERQKIKLAAKIKDLPEEETFFVMDSLDSDLEETNNWIRLFQLELQRRKEKKL